MLVTVFFQCGCLCLASEEKNEIGNWPVSIGRHVNPNKPVYSNTDSDGTSKAPLEHLQSSLGCFVLGCLLAGPLAGAADLSDGDAEREVGLVGLSLGLQQVVHWGLAYPRSILLQQTDGRLSGIHSQHLLNTKQKKNLAWEGLLSNCWLIYKGLWKTGLFIPFKKHHIGLCTLFSLI